MFNRFPVVSLVALVGGDELQFVGTGHTQLTGIGEMALHVNDTFLGNWGASNVEISYGCYPKNSFSDQNNYHCKQPGRSVNRTPDPGILLIAGLDRLMGK